jgi:hypothetical protein
VTFIPILWNKSDSLYGVEAVKQSGPKQRANAARGLTIQRTKEVRMARESVTPILSADQDSSSPIHQEGAE